MRSPLDRRLQRVVHLALGVALIMSVYATPEAGTVRAVTTQVIVAPLLVATGVLLWKGHVVRRALRRAPA